MKTVQELLEFSAAVEGQGVGDHPNCTYLRAELDVLACAVHGLPAGSCVVEIGSFAGRSASLYFQLQADLGLDIHLIDNWSWNQVFATRAFDSLVLEHFSEVPFTLHKMRSDYLGRRWDLPIDFIHIDGWHDWDGIEPDCRLWLPWVVPGGIAAFHDCDHPPVAKAIDIYVKSQGWSLLGEAGRSTVWLKPKT